MMKFAVLILAVGVALILWFISRDRQRAPLVDATSFPTVPKTQTHLSEDEQRFFDEVWPVAKTNIIEKLDALSSLGVVSPFATNRQPKLTKVKFAGQGGSVICLAVLDRRVSLGYHNLDRPGLKLRGIDSYKEIGSDENGVPYDDDHIRSRLNDPRVPQAVKDQLISTFTDTNLYPRLSKERASDIARRIFESIAERPDLYALNRERPFYSKADEFLSPNYIFIYDRIGQRPTANLAELDSIFITLRSSKDGIHLQHYGSSYYAFEAEAAVHGRR